MLIMITFVVMQAETEHRILGKPMAKSTTQEGYKKKRECIVCFVLSKSTPLLLPEDLHKAHCAMLTGTSPKRDPAPAILTSLHSFSGTSLFRASFASWWPVELKAADSTAETGLILCQKIPEKNKTTAYPALENSWIESLVAAVSAGPPQLR